MKRVFRIAVVIISVFVVILGVVLWRNHSLRIMKAEPEKVYKGTPLQPSTLPTNANTPKVKSLENESNTDVVKEVDVATKRIDDTFSPQKNDNTDTNLGEATLDEIAEQPTLSPEAAAAKKEYEKIHSEYTAVYNELKPLLDARPFDMDAIRLVNEKIKKVTQKRMDALENFALYSDEAFEELITTIAQQNASAEIMAEYRSDTEPEHSPEFIKLLSDVETMTPEERRRAIEKLSDLMEK